MKVLIVEDELLIARQVAMIVAEAGHEVVGIAATRREACMLAVAAEPDIAFVDLNLADGLTGTEVGDFLAEKCRAKVIYTTANLRRLPQDFAGAFGVVEKPFTKGGLLAALGYIAAAVCGGLLPDKVPASLRLAPALNAL